MTLRSDSLLTGADEKLVAARLFTHVDRLAGLIGPRYPGKPMTMDVTATYIEREFQAIGYQVQRQTFDAGPCEVANLVVECQGTDRPKEIIVIGAHYDTIPSTPGADDNASAVAMLIEVARLLWQHSFQRTLRFVAFACEEPPHFYTDTMGSQVYARRCRANNEQVVGMICLEMVGYYSSEPESQQVPAGIPRILRRAFPKRGDFLAAVGNFRSWQLGWSFRRGFKRASPFPLFSIVLPESISEIRLSDNSSFWDQGYPALMITDTSFLRNPHYHTESDTPETLDYPRMASATLGVAGGVMRLAQDRGQ